jgi:uncharacterized protein
MRGQIARSLERGLAAVALACWRRPVACLVLVAALSAVAAWQARRLRIDADLSHLLPASFESVRDLEVLKERFGGVGYVVPVLMGAEPDVLIRAGEDIAARLEALESIRYVDVRRPSSFFEERALYFLEREDLDKVRDRLRERQAWEKRHANPLIIDLEDSTPPSLDFRDLRESYGERGDLTWIRAQIGEKYYIDRDRRMLILLAKPTTAWADMAFARHVYDDVRRTIESMDLAAYGPDLRVGYTGAYVRRVEQHDVVQADLRLCSLLALGLVILFYAAYFRRVFAVVLIVVPIGAGLLWTYGFAAFTFGTLNILTGFIGAILLGLGDHGIHLLARFGAEHAAGREPEDAVRLTFGDTGRAVIVASVTSIVGFLGISLSGFRAFREFGVLAAAGMLLVVVAYVLCMPALLALATRYGWRPHAHAESVGVRHASLLHRRPRLVLAATIVLAALSVLAMRHLHFNYDLKSLEDRDLPSFRLDFETNRLLGYQQQPVIVLTDSLEEERAAASALRAEIRRRGDTTSVSFIAASADLVPGEQEAKREVIEEIGAMLGQLSPKRLSESQRELVERVRRMTATAPFDRDDLPNEVVRQFTGPEARVDHGFLLVFPNFLADGRAVRSFAAELRAVRLPDGKPLVAAGEPMIMADVMNMIAAEAPWVLGLTVLLIFVSLVLLLGNLRRALLNIAPAALTLMLTLGLLPLTGMELNYLNVMLIPVLFGLSIDGGAHITTRLMGGGTLDEVLGEVGGAIAGTILTNALGFGALLVADHPGLDSLGRLAVLGFAVNLLICLLTLPALVAWRGRAVLESGPVAAHELGDPDGLEHDAPGAELAHPGFDVEDRGPIDRVQSPDP